MSGLPSLSPKWTAILGMTIGSLLLGIQAYAYIDVGLIAAELLGGGIGLLLVGIVALFFHLDDRHRRRPKTTDEPPNEVARP